MSRTVLIALLLCAAPASTSSLQWTDGQQGGATVTVCEGDSVTFPWNYQTGPGETVTSVEWVLNGKMVIAFLSHGSFFPVPDFAARLQHSQGANGELVLKQVTDSDKGNYSVSINGADASGAAFSESRWVVVGVTEPLMSPDHHLHVKLTPGVTHDANTGQMSLQLTCGQFRFNGVPPIVVEWTTPSGVVMNSTGYNQDHFLLQLPAPVESGEYTCTLPPYEAGLACLPLNLTDVGHASYTLDGMEARLRLMEASHAAVVKDNEQLKKDNSALTDRLTAVENATAVLQAKGHDSTAALAVLPSLMEGLQTQAGQVSLLTHEVGDVVQSNQNLTQAVHSLQNETGQIATLDTQVRALQVSFGHSNISLDFLAKEIHMLEVIHINDNTSASRQFADIQAKLDKLSLPVAADAKKTVSFHAQLESNVIVSSGMPLIPTRIYNNDGDGYSNTTGTFTAPRDGTYFFIASAGSHSPTKDAYMEIVADGQQIATAYAHRSNDTSEMATCHGVVALTAGQQVWLSSLLDSVFNYADTFFSGFLVA